MDNVICYNVLLNDEKQYSIWPEIHEVPSGWTKVMISGTKEECMNYIESKWVDIRPFSLQTKMENL